MTTTFATTMTTAEAVTILDAFTLDGNIENLPINWRSVEAAYDLMIGKDAIHMCDVGMETTKEFWLLGQGLAYERGEELYILGDFIVTRDKLLRRAEEEADDYYCLWW